MNPKSAPHRGETVGIRTIVTPENIGSAVCSITIDPHRIILDSGGIDPADPPGSYLSSRIPYGINDDGSVRYRPQA